MYFITTKFKEVLLSSFGGVALTNCFSSIFQFGQISKFKKGLTLKKKMNQNFLWICASTHYILHNNKVSRNSVERFQRSYADKNNTTDWLTDWQVKKIIPSATHCLGYKYLWSSIVIEYFISVRQWFFFENLQISLNNSLLNNDEILLLNSTSTYTAHFIRITHHSILCLHLQQYATIYYIQKKRTSPQNYHIKDVQNCTHLMWWKTRLCFKLLK